MWPTNPNGAIIVTTRLESVGFVFCDDQMRLDPFSTEEGANYVLHLASLASGVPADIESARLLSDELGGLPLGINQMTALMRTQKTSLDKFLKLYRDDKHSYHLRHAAKSGKHLSTTWLVTFNALQKSPNCRSLLGILSLLEHTGVPEELFNHWSITKPRTTSDVLSFCKVENE
jgi:hypothetical protein